MRDDKDWTRTRRAVLVRCEESSQHRLHAEHVEIARADHVAVDRGAFAPGADRQRHATPCRDRFECARVLPEVRVERVGALLLRLPFTRGGTERDESRTVLYAPDRPEDERIHSAEDRGDRTAANGDD